jgi:hypothetical protein
MAFELLVQKQKNYEKNRSVVQEKKKKGPG